CQHRIDEFYVKNQPMTNIGQILSSSYLELLQLLINDLLYLKFCVTMHGLLTEVLERKIPLF
ncbi:MAG: hypothetical protein PVF74_10815, partial [Anaerolineales bacterium]